MIENKSKGIVIPAINGWYADTNPANASDPVPAIIERRKDAAQVGQPTNNPNPPPMTLPKIPAFELLFPFRVRLYDLYRSATFKPTRVDTKIISMRESGISSSPKCIEGRYNKPIGTYPGRPQQCLLSV